MTTKAIFDAPGPGFWELEAAHHGRRPVSHFLRDTYRQAFEDGVQVLLERYGLPLEGVRSEAVNGCFYVRPVGIGEGSKPKPPPPRAIMKVIARVHPEMRRRARTAARAWDERLWRRDADEWFQLHRPAIEERNLDLQSVDLTELADLKLADHVTEALAHFAAMAEGNMSTHGDILAVGDLLAHCGEWGIAPNTAMALLGGSSPATLETAELLAPVGRTLADAPTTPTSVDEVRALSPQAAAAVDAWLRRHGWRLVTTDDIDQPTLAERPALQLKALLAAPIEVVAQDPPDAAPVRERVPSDQRALFDRLLTEARYSLRMRDDNVGTRWNWSGGLLRRAVIETGRRLTARDLLDDPEHAVELTPAELLSLLAWGGGPSAAEAAARAAERLAIEALPPPDSLGEPEAPPPLDALQPSLARATAAMVAMLEIDGRGDDEPLHGVGIGIEAYTGPARVASSGDDALDRLQPGDVLIAPLTGPAYNSLLPILGGLVVEEGGAGSHAAIAAREFGLPAVIGAAGATKQIRDGELVEVDPEVGTVRVVG